MASPELYSQENSRDNERTQANGRLRVLSDLSFTGSSVLLRADLDVLPLEQDGPGARLTSIRASLDYILAHGAQRVILLGHIGRPDGIVDPSVSTYHLIDPLQEVLGREVAFAPDFTHVLDGQVILFENLRFWSGETSRAVEEREEFIEELEQMGDIFVNDAFGTCHREHASIVGLPQVLLSAAGRQIEKEVGAFEELFARPKEGFVTIIGGAKIKDKLPLINRLAPYSEYILVGGLLPKEVDPGRYELSVEGREIIVLPDNAIVADLRENTLDISEDSAHHFESIIKRLQTTTVFWNGPMGKFENEEAAYGTNVIADATAYITRVNDAFTFVGGGETEKCVRRRKLSSLLTHVSNGGGASLEYAIKKSLPGIDALRD